MSQQVLSGTKICKTVKINNVSLDCLTLFNILIIRLLLLLFAGVFIVFQSLFTDAEVLKYIPQYLIVSDFSTNNFSQMEKTFT